MTIDPLHNTPSDDALHAYVDGRLDPARRAAVAAWLEAHPARAAEVEGWKRDAERLRVSAAHPEHWTPNPSLAPAHLRRGLQARRRRRLGMAASWLFAFVIGGGAGWQMRDLHPAPSTLPMADAVAAYRQFADADAPPMEFDTARADDLQRWLSRHFGEAGRVPDLSPAGYRLMGGRLLSTEQGAAAMLVYQDGSGARVGFYVRPRGRLAGEGQRRDGDLLAHYWTDRGTSFALVSEAADVAARALPRLLENG